MILSIKEFNHLTEIFDPQKVWVCMAKRTQKFIYASEIDEEIKDHELPTVFNDLTIQYDEGIAYKTIEILPLIILQSERIIFELSDN